MESCQEENKIRVTWDDTIKNCYVYLHYTKDTEKLFYVGIGTHDLIQYHSKYTRAMQCAACGRNHILDVLNNKRNNIKGWEVEYDL